MKRFVVATMIFAALAPAAAFAHANLNSSVPAAGSAGPAPSALELSFSEVLNIAFSGVKLVGPDASVVDTNKPEPKGDGTAMSVSVPSALKPGDYTVDWNVLSVDGHKLEGSYRFTVTP